MSITLRGSSDAVTDQILDTLKAYEAQHPGASIEAYRHNSASVRVRILDPGFEGISRADRHEMIWRHLQALPDDVQSEVSLLLLLTPDEAETSYANVEFENPVPSRI